MSSEIVNRMIPIKLIDPHPRNFKVHPHTQLEELKASRKELMQYQSLVLWARPTGRYLTVIGHGRAEAWEQDGVQEVRADILPEDTPEDIIESILASNDEFGQHAQINKSLLNQLLKEQLQMGRSALALAMNKQQADTLLRQVMAEQKTDFLGPLLSPSPLPTREERDLGRSLPEQQGFPLSSDTMMMNLPFTQEERTTVLTAISRAKQKHRELSTQAQAVAWICQQFLEQG